MSSPLPAREALVCKLLIASVIYFITRIAYYFENYNIFSQKLNGKALIEAFAVSLVFVGKVPEQTAM